jgi:ankyrin repeat protein
MLRKRFRILIYLSVILAVFSSHGGSYEDFFRAVENNDSSAVRTLLERGFDPNTPNERGLVGLFLALRGGSLDVADVLVAHPQIRIDAPNALNETPLMMAALRGRLVWSRKLLDLGAKVQREGWSPLHYAATGPEPKVVELLLSRGAPVDSLAPDGSTALMMAALYGSEDSAELLLSRGASAKLRNARGQRASDLARGTGRESLATRLERASR